MRVSSAVRLQQDLERHLTPHRIGVQVRTRSDASLRVEAWPLDGPRVRQSFSLSPHRLRPPEVAQLADLIRASYTKTMGTWPAGPADDVEGSHSGA